MLDKVKTLKGYKLVSLDGEIGKVVEFYFDDQYWAIRYLVADTGSWLTGRQVLISPYSLGTVNPEGRRFSVKLTQKQIEDSPSLETDKPVSQQFERAFYGFYGMPMYWGGPYMWGASPYILRDPEKWKRPTPDEKAWDSHLRSTQEITGYHIQASDGEIGHICDFIVDDETWAIRYLIVDTRNWLPGKKVLIPPPWIERISWADSKVFVKLSRETIQQSPAYTDGSLLTRDYETGFHRHYERPGYWVDETAVKEHSHLPGQR